MSNLTLTHYILTQMNCRHTFRRYRDFWIIETESKEFWFYRNGVYYKTVEIKER